MSKTQTTGSPADKTFPKTLKKKIEAHRPLFRKTYSYISPEMCITGNLTSNENMVIDGNITGNIHCTQHVSVGATAHIEGTIESESALLYGYIKGSITTSKSVVVRLPATIIGDLTSASVHVESGVSLHGRIFSSPDHKNGETATKLPSSATPPVSEETH